MNDPPTRTSEVFSIHMDESIKNKINTNSNDLRRKTIKNNYDMEISRIYEIQNKENVHENLRRKTIINDQAMDVSEINHIQNNENIPNDLRRKTVNHFENMELSGIEPIESQENKLQLNARNTTIINEPADCSIETNSTKFDIPDVVKKPLSNFNEKLNRISLKEEQFEEFFKTTILSEPNQKEPEDQYITCKMEISMDMEDIETSNKLSKEILQKTIYFKDFSKKLDEDLETSSTSHIDVFNTTPANKRKTIVFNNEESVKLDVSKCNPLQKTVSGNEEGK